MYNLYIYIYILRCMACKLGSAYYFYTAWFFVDAVVWFGLLADDKQNGPNGREWGFAVVLVLRFKTGFFYTRYTLPETNIAHESPIFPGKYHQNGGFSMAMLVSGRVYKWKATMAADRVCLIRSYWFWQRKTSSFNDIKMYILLLRQSVT